MKNCICGHEMTKAEWKNQWVCHRCGRTKSICENGKFLKHGELQDIEIINALKEAAYNYEYGEILEVRDVLVEIVRAIDEYAYDYSI